MSCFDGVTGPRMYVCTMSAGEFGRESSDNMMGGMGEYSIQRFSGLCSLDRHGNPSA